MINKVGLFGTCGGSTWRNRFMARYDELGIEYYNPVVEDWDESCAKEEAEHLISDRLILFPVLGETYGFRSLGETGFSIAQAILLKKQTIVLVDEKVSEDWGGNPELIKESNKARALVRAHLFKVKHPNVFVVDTLEEMLLKSIEIML